MSRHALASLTPLLALALGSTACFDGERPSPADTDDATETDVGGTDSSMPQDTDMPADGSSESGSADTSGAGIEAARALFEPLVRAQCAQMFGCCDADEIAYRMGGVDSVNACVDTALDVMEAGHAPSFGLTPLYLSNYLIFFAYGLDPERTQVNEDAFAACEEAVASTACPAAAGDGSACGEQSYEEPSACNVSELFTGMQAAGDDCALHNGVECASDLTCEIVGSNVGFCVEALGSGAPCFEDYNCTNELICDYGTATCTEPGELGDTCAYPDAQNPQLGTETSRCRQGLRCDPVSESCQPEGCGFGSYCDDDDDACPEGLLCVAGRCDFLAQPGEDCWDDGDCDDGTCQYTNEGAFCFPLGALGDTCTDAAQCSSGYCDGSECAAAIAPGDPCDPVGPDGQCDDGYCDGTQCVAFGDIGDACPPAVCNWFENADCVDGECLAVPYPNGTPCGWSGQCMSGNCSGTCRPALTVGDACALGSSSCGEAGFCEGDGTSTEGECALKLPHAASCTSDVQCWHGCRTVYGERRCSGSAPGEAVCDGE